MDEAFKLGTCPKYLGEGEYIEWVEIYGVGTTTFVINCPCPVGQRRQEEEVEGAEE